MSTIAKLCELTPLSGKRYAFIALSKNKQGQHEASMIIYTDDNVLTKHISTLTPLAEHPESTIFRIVQISKDRILVTVQNSMYLIFPDKKPSVCSFPPKHTDTIRCAAARDELFITGSADKTLCVWNEQHSKSAEPSYSCRVLKQSNASIEQVHILDSALLSYAADGTVCMWHKEKPALIARMTIFQPPLLVTDQKLILGNSGDKLIYTDLNTEATSASIVASQGPIARNKNGLVGMIVTKSGTTSLKIWQGFKLKQSIPLSPKGGEICALLAVGGAFYFSESPTTLSRVNCTSLGTYSYSVIAKFKDQGKIKAMCYTDGRTLITMTDSTSKLFQISRF